MIHVNRQSILKIGLGGNTVLPRKVPRTKATYILIISSSSSGFANKMSVIFNKRGCRIPKFSYGLFIILYSHGNLPSDLA